jgi:hypothetical protein
MSFPIMALSRRLPIYLSAAVLIACDVRDSRGPVAQLPPAAATAVREVSEG